MRARKRVYVYLYKLVTVTELHKAWTVIALSTLISWVRISLGASMSALFILFAFPVSR
jgi:hypothetical protein